MAELEWRPCRAPCGGVVASDDDKGWEVHATDGGFAIAWGSLELTCDADSIEIAKQEAGHLLEALLAWGRQANERWRVRRGHHG